MSRISTCCAVAALGLALQSASALAEEPGLWGIYNDALKGAKYIDLTHTITPAIPVWSGFGPSSFAPSKAGGDFPGFATKRETFTWVKNGFEATAYSLTTDQLGTQL